MSLARPEGVGRAGTTSPVDSAPPASAACTWRAPGRSDEGPAPSCLLRLIPAATCTGTSQLRSPRRPPRRSPARWGRRTRSTRGLLSHFGLACSVQGRSERTPFCFPTRSPVRAPIKLDRSSVRRVAPATTADSGIPAACMIRRIGEVKMPMRPSYGRHVPRKPRVCSSSEESGAPGGRRAHKKGNDRRLHGRRAP